MTVVMAMEMLQLDGYGRVWGSLWSPQLKKFYYLDLSSAQELVLLLIHFN